ncbi:MULTISPECIES: LysR family transcriptional regulator [unclassified Achromobacter]|uniref:LysR family transcriptional regulator n=1 Tax=unclassified Achromobacter TaxID=2626865 RepID=UPI000B51D265|nr:MULTISPECIES: LysR family transcriptional regulator [unclassified Achromobacter]OWT80825.1 LysR family transcriptional regulator [Achromobacter sp. HZ34]OWT81341.1 LysR family transcriptional regulator [Achromobacter sp. HZ28]
MFNWENLRHFLAVGRAGTLSGAARALGVDHATVSRRLAALEIEVQAVLVERLPRACRLTPTGLQVLEEAKAMEMAAFSIERQARGSQTGLKGRVSLSAPPVLVTHFLAPRMVDFQAAYPGIQLSVSSEAGQVSLARGEADVALRMARPREAGSVTRRIGRMPFALYASRRYPALRDPARWTFIAYEQRFSRLPLARWIRDAAGARPVNCELSDTNSHLIAVQSGAGVAALPCFLGDAEKTLVRVENPATPFCPDLWLITHRDLKRNKAVRAAMDYWAEAFLNDPQLGPAAGAP